MFCINFAAPRKQFWLNDLKAQPELLSSVQKEASKALKTV